MWESEDEVLAQSRGGGDGGEFPREAWGSGVRGEVAAYLPLLQNSSSCSPTPARLYPALPLGFLPLPPGLSKFYPSFKAQPDSCPWL